MPNDTASIASIAALGAATDAARTEVQNLEAKLIGLQSARPSFIAENSFADAKVYDQDIADTALAVEQAKYRFRAAETAQFDAIYAADQEQKTLIFAAASLTNSVFWAKFDDAYVNAAIRLMSVIEGAEIMCSQIAAVNADNRPAGATPLSYAGNAIDFIKSKLNIPDSSGSGSYFMYRQRTAQYPEGTDPVADFLKEVMNKAASVLAQAANPPAP